MIELNCESKLNSGKFKVKYNLEHFKVTRGTNKCLIALGEGVRKVDRKCERQLF